MHGWVHSLVDPVTILIAEFMDKWNALSMDSCQPCSSSAMSMRSWVSCRDADSLVQKERSLVLGVDVFIVNKGKHGVGLSYGALSIPYIRFLPWIAVIHPWNQGSIHGFWPWDGRQNPGPTGACGYSWNILASMEHPGIHAKGPSSMDPIYPWFASNSILNFLGTVRSVPPSW